MGKVVGTCWKQRGGSDGETQFGSDVNSDGGSDGKRDWESNG